MASTTRLAKQTARQAEDSGTVEGLARLGFVARALIYVVIGMIALQVSAGSSDKADRQGALAAIREQPFGGGLLVALAFSFTGFSTWRLLQAAAGHRDETGRKRTVKRLASLGKALLYGSLAISTVRFLASGDGGDQTRPWTARALAQPGGRLLVGVVGASVVVAGLVMTYRGFTTKFLERLDLTAASPLMRALAKGIGLAALVGRGLVVVLLGAFLVEAAATVDPAKARGLDAALKTLAAQPFGPFLLIVAALGLLAFGAWSLVEARYRKV